MLQKLKNWIIKNELEFINEKYEKIKKEYNTLNIQKEELEKKQSKLIEKEKKLRTDTKKYFERKYKNWYKQTLQKWKDYIRLIVSNDLMPGNYVYVVNMFYEYPIQVQIKGIEITEEKIYIYTDQTEVGLESINKTDIFFKTYKDAIKYYNEMLESKKLNLYTNK